MYRLSALARDRHVRLLNPKRDDRAMAKVFLRCATIFPFYEIVRPTFESPATVAA